MKKSLLLLMLLLPLLSFAQNDFKLAEQNPKEKPNWVTESNVRDVLMVQANRMPTLKEAENAAMTSLRENIASSIAVKVTGKTDTTKEEEIKDGKSVYSENIQSTTSVEIAEMPASGNSQQTTVNRQQASGNASQDIRGTINGHEYVDLGLSVKWATCNVGASKPEDYGDYFAWGETSTKSSYTSDNSKTNGKQMNDIKGNSQYDAARANWGGTWRLPTKAELEELTNKCTWKWTAQNGVKGYKVTGPNGNSIFLPAAGDRLGSSLYRAGEYGRYWSSTPNESRSDRAYGLGFDRGRQYMFWGHRNYGRSVRPVSE